MHEDPFGLGGEQLAHLAPLSFNHRVPERGTRAHSSPAALMAISDNQHTRKRRLW